jgi:sulfur-oxidizing protein SoxY
MMPGDGATTRRTLLALAAGAVIGAPGRGRAEEDAAARAARWEQLRRAIFGNRDIADGSALIGIDAPQRALDAALVPVTLTLPADRAAAGLYFVIDNNPSPLAAHFTFGPKADPRALKLRVRVDQYTDMHAVMQTADGRLYAATRFIKASGGCSAPAGPDDAAALADIGRMKLRLLDGFAAGKPVEAALMVRHPNFNGMQMDQITRHYTPARFIRSIDVAYNGGNVFHLDSDISLSTDPVIGFAFVPDDPGTLTVIVQDSANARWERRFPVPPSGA